MDVQICVVSILVKFHFAKNICRILSIEIILFQKDKCTKAAVFDMSKTAS